MISGLSLISNCLDKISVLNRWVVHYIIQWTVCSAPVFTNVMHGDERLVLGRSHKEATFEDGRGGWRRCKAGVYQLLRRLCHFIKPIIIANSNLHGRGNNSTLCRKSTAMLPVAFLPFVFVYCVFFKAFICLLPTQEILIWRKYKGEECGFVGQWWAASKNATLMLNLCVLYY